jgi:hypothetical protein
MTDAKDINTEFAEICAPAPSSSLLTAVQMQAGPAIDPLKRLFLYSADEWEGFIEEWASVCLKSKYQKVQRFTGANDKGIDIAGFVDNGLLMGVGQLSMQTLQPRSASYGCLAGDWKDPLVFLQKALQSAARLFFCGTAWSGHDAQPIPRQSGCLKGGTEKGLGQSLPR